MRAARYAGTVVERHTVTDEGIAVDALDVDALRSWFSGDDPTTGERRGRELTSPATDLVFDATVNAPKSFSLAAVLDDDLAAAYDALQDRLRDRTITMWKDELNARRGRGGIEREELAQVEVVELRHERSRALDAHKHRHLWLNAKVLGRDGKWSSVDSRVMLRLQNVINAEGDLAARTDPEWLAALAAKGCTLDPDTGEIAQLAAAVRPLSRRANQIEANRTVKMAEWQRQHPGQDPGPDVLAAIDQWAWSHQRPEKPATLDEDEWRDTVRREIADIDPAIIADMGRSPVPVGGRSIADIDRDDLAMRAVTDADTRAARNGGRFSDFDLRAGAVRAVAASGVAADRSTLAELIEDVSARATDTATVTLLDETDIPGHVKARMATRTVSAKSSLADKLDGLAEPGVTVDADVVTAVATEVFPSGRSLGDGQTAAAAAVGGTDRLVTVTGPAGTGKTTMLSVARRLLENQDRRMVIVAPTKKAATVAGQETGADATSLHALLHDYGFRWTDTPAGQQWTRLVPGQDDPQTGQPWPGAAKVPLAAGDRIVVDEAGMVDLHTANALADVAGDTGAGIAMVGDHLQALPVGHSGAMSLARSRSTATVELDTIHRFRTANGDADTAWADLSLRLRDAGQQTEAVAAEIVATGHAVTVATEADARGHMVNEWLAGHAAGHSVALVTATHDEAQAISEAIQARRVEAGHLVTDRPVTLQSGQVAYVGDVVQTRRNDRGADVENRQVWTIHRVDDDGTVTLEQGGVMRHVDAAYVEQHTHLAYASTVHGVQGETTDRALVGPGVDAAGLYVGLTRGRRHNTAVVIADDERGARTQLVESMQRGQIEATLDDAREAARADLAHAARRPHVPIDDTGQTAPWHDRQARPMGHIVDLEKVISDVTEREKALHEQLAGVSEKLAVDEAARDEVQVKIATAQARQHATGTVEDASRLEPTSGLLNERIGSAKQERAGLSREYRHITRRLSAATREQGIREQLGGEIAIYETGERRRALRQRFANEAPAWDDRKARPLGRVVTLRALRVSTVADLEKAAAERDERSDRITMARQMLRGGAGPDGVELTAEQREKIGSSLDIAADKYDRVVDRHTSLTRRLRGIDREQTIRDELASSDSERATQEARARSGIRARDDQAGVVPTAPETSRGPSLA